MARLELLVDVNTKGAEKLQTLGGKLQSVGKGMTVGLTLPILAAGGAVTQMAADAEKAQAKVNSVFESMDAAAWTSVDALNAHAEAMAKSTTFDDDAVKDAQATLLTFGEITGETFTDATEAAADMAAFFETDMSTAALTLGKALQDPVDGLAKLGRQGVIFTDEQKAAVQAMVDIGDTAGAQALILAEVQKQVGNVAEDLAATAGGQMAQAMNELGEAGEAMGTFLLPLLSGLAGVLKTLAGIFTALPGPIQGLVVGFLGIAALAGPVMMMVGSVVGGFKAISTAFSILKLALLANPFVALAAAVAAIVVLVVLNWDKIVAVFKGALSFISEVGGKLWTPISEGFGAAIDFIRGVWNAFARWWNSIEISVPSFDIPFVGTVGGFSIGLPDLPMLAEGGIVNGPTLALIGERGPEAVIPLPSNGLGGSGDSFTFNVTGQVDEERIVRMVTRAQRLNKRLAWQG